jgi:TRAP-type C4-dicarboxylate transport system permease small subunit
MASTLVRIIDKICDSMGIVSGMIVALLCFLNAYAVIMGYLFNMPPHWSLDISEFLLVGTVFFGGAYALQLDAHANIPLLVANCSPYTQLVLKFVTCAIAAIFAALLIWKGGELALDNLHTQTSSFSRLPVFPSYIVVPIGGVFLLLQAISKAIKGIHEYRGSASRSG